MLLSDLAHRHAGAGDNLRLQRGGPHHHDRPGRVVIALVALWAGATMSCEGISNRADAGEQPLLPLRRARLGRRADRRGGQCGQPLRLRPLRQRHQQRRGGGQPLALRRQLRRLHRRGDRAGQDRAAVLRSGRGALDAAGPQGDALRLGAGQPLPLRRLQPGQLHRSRRYRSPRTGS